MAQGSALIAALRGASPQSGAVPQQSMYQTVAYPWQGGAPAQTGAPAYVAPQLQLAAPPKVSSLPSVPPKPPSMPVAPSYQQPEQSVAPTQGNYYTDTGPQTVTSYNYDGTPNTFEIQNDYDPYMDFTSGYEAYNPPPQVLNIGGNEYSSLEDYYSNNGDSDSALWNLSEYADYNPTPQLQPAAPPPVATVTTAPNPTPQLQPAAPPPVTTAPNPPSMPVVPSYQQPEQSVAPTQVLNIGGNEYSSLEDYYGNNGDSDSALWNLSEYADYNPPSMPVAPSYQQPQQSVAPPQVLNIDGNEYWSLEDYYSNFGDSDSALWNLY
jgi:hypothetical protein